MRSNKTRLLLLAFALTVFAALGKCAGQIRTLDEHFEQLNSKAYSGAIFVAKNGTVLAQRAFGFASCDQSTPNSTDTVFSIGSITKDFTRAAIAKLDAAGRIEIDQPISNYLEGVPEDKEDITVEHLLNHRSGLRTYHETQNLGDFESQTKKQALSTIFQRSVLFSPGSRENYSNSGYTVLAAIIEEVTGQSYVDYIRNNLLIPAGMVSTGFWGETFPSMASSENTVLGCGTTQSWEYSWVLVGNGGMVSTVGDLHKWIKSLRDNTLFNDASREKYGYKDMFENGFGTAGGSNQHNFNATIEYSAGASTLVIAISNGGKLPAESVGIPILRTTLRSIVK